MKWILIPVIISLAVAHCSSDSLLPFSKRSLEAEKTKRCTYLRTHGMLGVDCSHLELHDIPENLRTGVEVLDLTYNRIRELYNTSFENYSYLKILYLTDNIIYYIEAGAFEPISDLQILDLTLNPLHFVPEAFGTLTSLKKLMLANNKFVDVTFPTVMPSVQYLSLSSCNLKKFPDFSMLPGLVQLNISDNQLQTIELTQVAAMCSLKVLDLRNNPRLFRREHCNCQLMVRWFGNLTQEGFELLPDVGSICKNTTEGREVIDDPEVCFTNTTYLILEKGQTIRRSCEAEVERYASAALRLKASARWVLIVLVSLAVIFVFSFCMYYVRKRHVMVKGRAESPEQSTLSKTKS